MIKRFLFSMVVVGFLFGTGYFSSTQLSNHTSNQASAFHVQSAAEDGSIDP